jgi:hypothetical protein
VHARHQAHKHFGRVIQCLGDLAAQQGGHEREALALHHAAEFRGIDDGSFGWLHLDDHKEFYADAPLSPASRHCGRTDSLSGGLCPNPRRERNLQRWLAVLWNVAIRCMQFTGMTMADGVAVMKKPYRLRDVGCALKIIDELARFGRTQQAFPRSFRLLTEVSVAEAVGVALRVLEERHTFIKMAADAERRGQNGSARQYAENAAGFRQ